MKKQTRLIYTSLLIILATVCAIILWYNIVQKEKKDGTIPIGILHSLTGTMAISEKPVVDATLLAIEEINQAGGVLGKKITPIIVDGKSDWPTFAKKAKTLITKRKVPVVFGCWTSASRKTVKPVFEKYNHLLFYPVQYEGLETSKNIVYTGATTNQQVVPGVTWCFYHLGKRFFLVGSDYVFPRTANAIIKEVVQSIGGTIVGEEYLLLGSKDVNHIVEKIAATKPQVIINTINGDSNIPFFKGLRKAGITPERIPTMSFSIAEPELKQLDIASMIGDYATWSYFQSIDTPANRTFVKKIQKKYGADHVISDPMEAAYFGVYLWAQAANEAHSFEPEKVRAHLQFQSFNAPEGVVSIDPLNQHTWKRVRIGKVQSTGQFNIIWDSQKTVRPQPFPFVYRSKQAWEEFLMSLYKQWNNSWAAS